MQESNITFVGVKISQISSGDHVLGSLLGNGHRLFHCILQQPHLLLQMRKFPNCPVLRGRELWLQGGGEKRPSHPARKGPAGINLLSQSGDGSDQEEEELDSLAGPSTSVLWKAWEVLGRPGYDLKGCRRCLGGQKSNLGSWEEHRPGSSSVSLGTALDPFESRFPHVSREAAPPFRAGVRSEGEEVSQRLRDLRSWACLCCCPLPHRGFLSCDNTRALCPQPCVHHPGPPRPGT